MGLFLKMESNESSSQAYNSNRYYTSSSALEIRLNTENLLLKIESFLRGGSYIMEEDKDSGKISTKFISQGDPKANREGVQSILNYLTSVFNPQVVQGNFTEDQYDKYVLEVNINLLQIILTNCPRWEINDDDIEYIIDFIMMIVIPYMSRTLDNKERESYADTFKTTESTTIRDKGGSTFGIPQPGG